MLAKRLVGDRAGQFPQPPLQRRAPLGRVETLAFRLAQKQHFGERGRRFDDRRDRGSPSGPRKIVGILTLRQQREAQGFAGPDER
jgi:hypothetical protein